MASELAVVIPTRERWETLRLTLAALEEQTEQGFETIVVVDGTDQQPPELPGVRVLQQAHAGPGVARNRGVGATDRPVILFIGDDMIPSTELVARHVAHHRDQPADEVAVLGQVVWHPSVPRDRLHGWLQWSGALFDFPAVQEGYEPDAGWARFYSCNVSIKREFFLASGGFDPGFVFDYEDLDLAWRLGQRGMRLIYEPGAVTRHLHRYDWPTVKRRYESRAGAERLMMAKHDWFRPWFHDQMTAAQREPRASRLWTLAADRIPRSAPGVRDSVQKRADRHYRQRLAPTFLAAWEASKPVNPPTTSSPDVAHARPFEQS
jgi:GT2 family glycosyltransferase